MSASTQRHLSTHEIAGSRPVKTDKATSRKVSDVQLRAIGNRALGQLLQSKKKTEAAGSANTAEQGSVLPNHLRGSLESLSGIDLSNVRVHKNSPRPAELNALAYTQGRDIHLGPGQDEHLPHEAWHAVQQMQGRVIPTRHSRGVAVNDDAQLEREADVMGSKVKGNSLERSSVRTSISNGGSKGVAQRKVKITGLDDAKQKKFCAKISDGSALEFELDKSGFLQQKDAKKTATDEYSKQIVAAIADGQTVDMKLIAQDDAIFGDSFVSGAVDYEDMVGMPSELFRSNFMHFVVERFAIADYEKKKAKSTKGEFAAAHKKGQEAQERQLKEWYPKKTIKYKGAGYDNASKVVDKAGNGSIDYYFDFTDVKQVFKQHVVGGAVKESIISSKIEIVR